MLFLLSFINLKSFQMGDYPSCLFHDFKFYGVEGYSKFLVSGDQKLAKS